MIFNTMHCGRPAKLRIASGSSSRTVVGQLAQRSQPMMSMVAPKIASRSLMNIACRSGAVSVAIVASRADLERFFMIGEMEARR